MDESGPGYVCGGHFVLLLRHGLMASSQRVCQICAFGNLFRGERFYVRVTFGRIYINAEREMRFISYFNLIRS